MPDSKKKSKIIAFFSNMLVIIAVPLFAMGYQIIIPVLCALAIILGVWATFLGEKMSKTGIVMGLGGIVAYLFVLLF